MRRLLLVVVLLVVAGCGSAPPPPAAAPAAVPLDPFTLLGAWKVDGTDDVVLIDPERIQVRTAAGMADGDWRADAAGRFLAGFSSYSGPAMPDSPVARAVAFGVAGDARELRGGDGGVLARLLPIPVPSDAAESGVDPTRQPSPEQRQAATAPAALPAGLRPAADPAGRWVPQGWTGPTKPGLEFRSDGTVGASDGCNQVLGRWVAGADGGLLVAGTSVMTLIGCAGVPVPEQVTAARRVAFDGDTLVLLDGVGAPTGRFTRG